jgi:molybdate transport system ATP-binding protein
MNRIQITARLGALDLQVDTDFANAFIIISGENGAGKTTLLRCLAGLETGHGQVIVNDRLWLDDHTGFVLPAGQRNVGCVWADAALLPWLSVEKNITLGSEQVDQDWLAQLAGQLELTILMQRSPHMLSTGEAQRVALVRAIFKRPSVLLLDEPFSAQAPAIRQRLRLNLKSMQAALQIPVIMVSHDAEDAQVLAHQHWRMREGKLLVDVAHAGIQQELQA